MVGVIPPPAMGEGAVLQPAGAVESLPRLFGEIVPTDWNDSVAPTVTGDDGHRAISVGWVGVVEENQPRAAGANGVFEEPSAANTATDDTSAPQTVADTRSSRAVESTGRDPAIPRPVRDATTRPVSDVAWYRSGPVALGAVLAVIMVAAMLVKRLVRGTKLGRTEGLQVISRTYLSPKQSIALVQMGARMVFVGITPQGMTTLRTVRDAQEAAMLRGGSRLATVKGERFDARLEREAAEFIGLSENTGAPASPMAAAKRDVSGLLSRLRTIGGRGAAQPV
ncbi:MAG: FliO/MopB family protein [Phycisphaerales bacterium]|nr:FliO/MopB family protein [Phycisphaerales bacterium]